VARRVSRIGYDWTWDWRLIRFELLIRSWLGGETDLVLLLELKADRGKKGNEAGSCTKSILGNATSLEVQALRGEFDRRKEP